MAKPKRSKPAARVFITLDKAEVVRTKGLATKATRENDAVVSEKEMERRVYRNGLVITESCRECRAGTCDGAVHVRPSQTAAAQKDATIGDLVAAADGAGLELAVDAKPKPIEPPKVVVATGAGPLFDGAPALIVADAPAAPKRKRSTSTARTYPEGFALTDEMRAYAVRNGIAADRVDDMFEHFSNHHRAKGSKFVDWTLAFYTWVRNDRQFLSGRANQRQADPPTAIQGGGKDGIPW